ncbi:MAG: thioredoxin family protein [Polaromonas sp.]|uniref:thioredoxin family protein n=1 Tax=Polaromonas sp. TaxID=1869339 RepID=UPI0027309D02|nr:thioredoxin family protein [Polaromonas sp.]MDP2449443.1 thioredoxin family protein [Polaromonas sp.]MDP3247944.1 thioredoxin family protein [Polaromonas sp.]MDP3754397.1 thioredoxin family protein [Polaromonas sp.]
MLNHRVNRRIFSGALLTAPWAAAFTQTAHAAAVVGQAGPDFSAPDTAGKTHRLSDYKGKLVVLEWTNPGCPFVQKHYSGNMQGLQKEAVGKGVVWLAINSTETGSGDYLAPARLAGWMRDKQAAASATLMDESGSIGQLYGALTTPHMYIISPQGRLLYAGAIDSIASARVDDIRTATNYVRQGLNEALAGKALSVASSRAYGCSIKYKDKA